MPNATRKHATRPHANTFAENWIFNGNKYSQARSQPSDFAERFPLKICSDYTVFVNIFFSNNIKLLLAPHVLRCRRSSFNDRLISLENVHLRRYKNASLTPFSVHNNKTVTWS